MKTSAARDNDNLLFIEDDYQALIWRPFKAHDDVIDEGTLIHDGEQETHRYS